MRAMHYSHSGRWCQQVGRERAGPGEDKTCETNETELLGRPCFDMRTGSRYEDKWIIPGSSQIRSVQNHEYIEGRFGELIFNDTITSADFSVGAWVVRQRYENPAAMNSSDEHLNAVFELCRYTSEATSLDLYADSNARQRSADCMADDTVAMRLAYATSGSLALQRFMMKQRDDAAGPLSDAASWRQAE